MAEEQLRPFEAAARLGMAANTLRVYSTRFAPLLSSGAATPSAGRAGRPGHRLYSAGDLAILGRARELVDDGLTYEQALNRLRGSQTVAEPTGGRTGAAPLLPDATAQLGALQQAVDAWRALADERGRELTQLRARLEALRRELDEERRRRSAAEELARLTAAERRAAESSKQQRSWLGRLVSGEPAERDLEG